MYNEGTKREDERDRDVYMSVTFLVEGSSSGLHTEMGLDRESS